MIFKEIKASLWKQDVEKMTVIIQTHKELKHPIYDEK